MKKESWAEKNQPRIDETLARFAAIDEKPKKSQQTALVSFYCNSVNKGQDALSMGEALYYVCSRNREKNTVTLLHGARLQTVELSRRAFDEGLTQVWWPEEYRSDTTGVHCDPAKYAALLEKQANLFASMQKSFSQEVIRRAIADLRGVALETVTQFKPKAKQQGEIEMPEYMKKAKKLADEWDAEDEQEEETTTKKSAKKPVAKKHATGKKSAATKAGHDKPKAKASSEREKVERKAPKVGTVFSATYKGKEFSMKVVKDADGDIGYKVGKEVYGSPSSAGSAVIGGACNGWKFWHID